jgi:hypothetical protein
MEERKVAMEGNSLINGAREKSFLHGYKQS